ncbi:MAG: methyl-accepting chemotaxis protein [Gammaproteobacteria bacterium]
MREFSLRSTILPLAGPLALTILFVAAQALGGSTALVLSAMAAMVGAWLALALWALRRSAGTPVHVQAMNEQTALMGELREFVGREVFGAHGELDRSRRLIREAVVQLNGSFRSMEEQSRQQRTMISCLVEDDGAGSAGVRQFADTAATLMERLTQTLTDDSRESVRTVQLIGEMVRQIEEVFELLGELKGISDQAAKITSDAVSPTITDHRNALRLFAYDVRNLSSRSTSMYERIHSLTSSTKAIVDRIRHRVEDSAERGMNVSVEARARADEVINQVVAINRSLVSGMGLVSDCGTQIRQDVTNAVRSLQFEDITNQAMTAASVHIDRLRAINQDAVQLQQVLAATHGEDTGRKGALESFARLLRAKRNEWRRPMHKPVSQVTLASGSVELF